MKRVLEIPIEAGDTKVTVVVDEQKPDVVELEIQREDGKPLLSETRFQRVAA